MFNYNNVKKTLTNLGFSQPVQGKDMPWFNAVTGITAYRASYSMIKRGSKLNYVFCRKSRRVEVFSEEMLEPVYLKFKDLVYDATTGSCKV